MKYKIIYLISLFSFLFFTGCLRTYYPALYQSSASPMILERNDSIKNVKRYYSADVTLSKGNYENESLQILRGSYIIVDTREHVNFNTKVFGYTGIYHVSGLENYDGPKSIIGLGGEFGFNLNFKIKSVKIGAGISGGVTGELGSYYSFRNSADKENKINSEPGPVFFTLSVFPIIAYEPSESSILSAQINLGLPGFISPNIVFNKNGYVYWLSWIPEDRNMNSSLGGRYVFGFMMNADLF